MDRDASISRRTLLRGLGTAVALPVLQSLAPAMSLAAGPTVRGAAAPPVRMAFIYVPNGVNVSHWWPATTGARFELPRTLSPLASVRDDILVLGGLTQDKGRANGDGAGDHARDASSFLTGAQAIKTPGANIRVGVSVDQLAAQKAGRATRFPSLELGCDGGSNSGNCDSGYSCAYSNNISWKSATTPGGKEIDPRLLFDRLFAGGASAEVAASRHLRETRRRSVLDFVLDDARRLEGSLGGADRRKLDEYLTSVRDLETRIGARGRVVDPESVSAPEGLPPEAGAPLAYVEHIRLLNDLLVLAFQTDMTRVATFMYARAGSNRNYRHVGVPDGHHDLSHHESKPEKLAKIAAIDRFHVAELARFLERLKAVPEGDGTLLDNCMIVYGSGLGDGNRHNHDDLPVLLAGSGGGSIDTGRYVRAERETPMCNLFLSMLDRFGVEVGSFGDATGRLSQLTV